MLEISIILTIVLVAIYLTYKFFDSEETSDFKEKIYPDDTDSFFWEEDFTHIPHEISEVKSSPNVNVLEIELTKEGLMHLIKQHFSELYGGADVTVWINDNLKTKIKIIDGA